MKKPCPYLAAWS